MNSALSVTVEEFKSSANTLIEAKQRKVQILRKLIRDAQRSLASELESINRIKEQTEVIIRERTSHGV